MILFSSSARVPPFSASSSNSKLTSNNKPPSFPFLISMKHQLISIYFENWTSKSISLTFCQKDPEIKKMKKKQISCPFIFFLKCCFQAQQGYPIVNWLAIINHRISLSWFFWKINWFPFSFNLILMVCPAFPPESQKIGLLLLLK